jgi:hypothetical protein
VGLIDVLSAIEAEATNANDSRIPANLIFRFGPVASPQHLQCPSVVWLSDESPIEPAEKGGYNPQQIYTQRTRVQCQIWGADPDKRTPATQPARDYTFTESIKDGLLVAMFDIAEGSIFPLSVSDGEPDNLQFGWMFVIVFDVLLPVTREPDPDVQPTTAEVTAVIDPTP